MLPVIYILLMLNVGRCTDDQKFVTKSVVVGQSVALECPRNRSIRVESLYWIRLVSGAFPDFLGGTFAFDYKDVTNTSPRITAKQEPGTFILHISEAKLSDTGVYYCLKVDQLDMKFLKGEFLKIKGQEPDVTTIIQHPLSDPVHAGDSVTLQCSVLSESEGKLCSGRHSVYWFRTGFDESHPSIIYADENSSDQCENGSEAHSPQKCFYNFSKSISSSDAGTYYCAVATCGQILFGNGTKLDMEASHTGNLVLFLLYGTLAISMIVNALLIYTIKKKSFDSCKDAATVSGNQRRQQRDENTLDYSVAMFIRRKAGKAETRNEKPAEGETVYTDVSMLAKH
ncbi:hypothetical protein Q5P01_008511 [Channa striata]|uniref:Ig-like domain-containing protein n=1 Tax=Channa striata TaxID=64152 RepID=A0AA88MZR0_CHASR|nr:hypothetical protein Q5P01_008511 [Channa striata]